jgi:cell division topological specificity factor
MAGLWTRLFGRTKLKSSGSALTAKERLQFILVHDRLRISPENLKAMKQEILAVISKYVAVSGSDIDIAFKQSDGQSNMLIAEIPFLKGIRPTVQADEDEGTDNDTDLPDDEEQPGETDSETIPETDNKEEA